MTLLFLPFPFLADRKLVLHTSGTTGRPKGTITAPLISGGWKLMTTAVPLTHRNLTRTMENIVNTYELTREDRSYLVMPLFHVHGLLAGFLAPLHSGGTVIMPPKFSASTFWPEFTKFKATWYTAGTPPKQSFPHLPLLSVPTGQFPRSIRSSSAIRHPTQNPKSGSSAHAPQPSPPQPSTHSKKPSKPLS